MSRIKITNAVIIPMTEENLIINSGEIHIEDGTIVFAGAAGDVLPDWRAEETIDAGGMVAMPGFVNCHTHAAMTLLRSYADDLPLMEWLEQRIWPMEEKLTGEDVYWGTMLCIFELLKSGTTCFADMYFFMNDVARAVAKSGIRASLSRGMVGVNPNAQNALVETEQFIEEWNGAADGRIKTMVGPHAPYTCPPDYLKKVLAIAEKYSTGVHIHLAETRIEFDDITKQYRKTPVEYLYDCGVLDFNVLAAHCVHVTENDIKILKEKNIGVAHNPESNMKLASGIAPVSQMLERGVIVGIGTDGAASNNNLDMMEEMRSAALLQKVSTGIPTVIPSYQALEMATKNGGRVLGLDVGVIREGYKADIILIDFEKPHLYPKHDLIAHTVYAAQSSDVDTVIVDGTVLMRNRKLLTIDEREVLVNAERCAKRMAGEKTI
ncbi:amidohydrolase [Phosphitispora sp. TUW77]|uniref:amidohydrolase n=1 Tax=Phosphitispora sp. TUW77 TaxID=3152361 RepID=UPI003AB1E1C7